AVYKQKVGHGVISQEEVEVAVIIDVGGYGSPSFPRRFQQPRLTAHVGEVAASIVPVQVAGHWIEDLREAVVALGFGGIFAFTAVGVGSVTAFQAGIVGELRDEQIEFPVV